MAIKFSEQMNDRINKLEGWLAELPALLGDIRRDENGRAIDIDQLSNKASRLTDIIVELKAVMSDFGYFISNEPKVRTYLKKVSGISDADLDEIAALPEIQIKEKA